MEEVISLQFPDPSRLLPHQKQVMFDDPHRFKVLVWHRRARKTTTAITEIVRQAHARVGVYWLVFPRFTEAKDAVWRDPNMLFSIIPEELIKQVNSSELVVYFKNGSLLQLKGSDEPDSLRGANPLGIIFDEYDTQKNEGWPIVQPIIRANGGWVWFIGTPRGKQKLWELYNLGQSGHKEWKSYRLKASESGIIAPDQLEESKKTMSPAMYNQEYETEFLEGEGGVFRGVRDIATAKATRPVPGKNYIIGCDLAKVKDFTVLSVFDRSTNKQVNQDRFQTLEWPFQKARIKALSDIYNRALVVVDATGLGNPIVDDLIRSGVPVEPVNINQTNKKEMIEKLSIWIDQRKIEILPIDETLIEYDNFGYKVSEQGRISYAGMGSSHDDIVMSHALAVFFLHDIIRRQVQPEDTPIRAHMKRVSQRFGEWADPWEDW